MFSQTQFYLNYLVCWAGNDNQTGMTKTMTSGARNVFSFWFCLALNRLSIERGNVFRPFLYYYCCIINGIIIVGLIDIQNKYAK